MSSRSSALPKLATGESRDALPCLRGVGADRVSVSTAAKPIAGRSGRRRNRDSEGEQVGQLEAEADVADRPQPALEGEPLRPGLAGDELAQVAGADLERQVGLVGGLADGAAASISRWAPTAAMRCRS